MKRLWGIALFLQVIHLLYHQITTLFDLYPFNNIRSYTRKQQLIECVSCGITMGFPVIVTLFGGKILVGSALVCLGLLLIGEFLSWWQHYFFGPRDYWKEVYKNKFEETLQILPKIKNNPRPNLEHVILHSITVITFFVTLIYFVRL